MADAFVFNMTDTWNSGGTSFNAVKMAVTNTASAATSVNTYLITDDATTNAVVPILRLSHTTTGTPANGIGTSLQFETETTAGNNEIGVTLEAVVTDVTSTSEDFDLVVKTMAAGATAAERLRVSSLGHATTQGAVFTPNSSFFCAVLAATSAALTGDGTAITVPHDTEIYDVASDFASNTYTARYSGKHRLSGTVNCGGVSASNTDFIIEIVTSNRTYRVCRLNPSGLHVSGTLAINWSVLADMGVNHTALVQLTVSGAGAKNVTIVGNGSPIGFFQGEFIG